MVNPQSNNVVCGFPLAYSVSLDTLLLFPSLKLTILKCSVFLLNVGKYPKRSSWITICYKNMHTHSFGAYLTNIQHPRHLYSVFRTLFPKYIPVALMCDGIHLIQTSPNIYISDISVEIRHQCFSQLQWEEHCETLLSDTGHWLPSPSLHSSSTLTQDMTLFTLY